MCSHGVWQLKSLTVFLSNGAGSSAGTRQFLQSPEFHRFASSHTHLKLAAFAKGNRHPFLQGVYRCGAVHTVSLRNADVSRVLECCQLLVNRSGRVLPHGKWSAAKDITQSVGGGRIAGGYSVQGHWDETFTANRDARQQLESRVQVRQSLQGICPVPPLWMQSEYEKVQNRLFKEEDAQKEQRQNEEREAIERSLPQDDINHIIKKITEQHTSKTAAAKLTAGAKQ